MSVPFRERFPKLFLIDLQIFQRVLQLLWVNKTLSLRSETLDSSCPLPSSSKLQEKDDRKCDISGQLGHRPDAISESLGRLFQKPLSADSTI